MRLFIQSVNGKADKKDLNIIKKFTEAKLTFDDQHKTGWMAEVENTPEAELLAMRLKAAGLSKQYFLRAGDNAAINLF